ncbi:cytochrome P450 [Coprinopsis marcescibilis]|uniref:Cytochrome P450 n=1 Tax=Coprinopsis marcescibilis TaxID=230819 RepID=A0A5C3LF37_COPMA|nr:cytochrome P450 [Coprinopsis marcescibilis]
MASTNYLQQLLKQGDVSSLRQAAIIVAATCVLWKIIRNWTSKRPLDKIPGPKSSSYVTGNLMDLFQPDGLDCHDELAKNYPGVAKVPSMMGISCRMSSILRRFTISWSRFNKIIFGDSLLATLGDHHRKQRKLLNPVFSIAMREMILIFYNVAYKLRDSIHGEVSNGKNEVDVHSWASRTALEIIGQSGLGTSFDRLEPDSPSHPSLTPSRTSRRPVQNICDIFESKKRAFELGDDAIREQVSKVTANMSATEEDKLPEEELIAQMSTLMFAAMDTTSNALSRTLDILSAPQDAHDRLRQEILEAKKLHGELSYDELNNLTFLDAVCRETLRLYPPAPVVLRETRQDTVLPLARTLTTLDGKQTNEIMVPRGTQVIVSIMSCNKDPLIWGPDANEWKPERWLSPPLASFVDAHIPGVYSHLMTFIGGNRACIGFKISQLEMKVILCILLGSFKFTQTDKKVKWRFNGLGITQPAVDSPAGYLKTSCP